MSIEDLFFSILLGHILYMEYHFGHLYGRTIKPSCQAKIVHTRAVFHLNDRRNVPRNLKRKLHT